jgi:hypothetical protein
MANRLPLVFDSTESKIKELPAGDNLSMINSSIVDAINITATGTITANTLNVQNLNAAGGSIAAVALSNSYNDLDNRPTLFSGDYNDLINKPTAISSDWADITNKPIIPSSISQLINDTNFITNSSVAITPDQVVGIAEVAKTNSYTDLINKPDLSVYVRTADLVDGTLTVEINNTGNLEGSVFGSDSTVIIDHLNNAVNLTGGPVSGNRSIGSPSRRFDNIYIDGNLNIEGSLIFAEQQKTVGVTGLTIEPTGNDQDILNANLDALQDEYDRVYDIWLGLEPESVEREDYNNNVVQPALEAINEYQDFINDAKSVVRYDYNANTVLSDRGFGGVFYGELVGDILAENSSVILNGETGAFFGNVVATDETVMINTTDKSINATNVYATTHWGNLSKNGSILSITADTGIQLLPGGVFNVPNATNIDIDATGTIDITATGNLTLSSTSGTVSVGGHISIADLQTLVAASTDFADFKSRIAAL